MADIHKRLEKAEKYLQKGKPKEALEEYLSILDDEPNQDAVRQQAADIHITLGQNFEACQLLSVLFDKQAAINDHAKAIANYKKLARLGIPTVDQTFKFSQLIEKSDKKQALEGYSLASKAFLAASRRDEALAANKRRKRTSHRCREHGRPPVVQAPSERSEASERSERATGGERAMGPPRATV